MTREVTGGRRGEQGKPPAMVPGGGTRRFGKNTMSAITRRGSTMRRRQFIGALSATALLSGTHTSARTLASLANGPGGLPARTLTGGETLIPSRHVEALAASLRGAVILPGSESYDTARKVWNGLFDRRPALIARCSGTADVVKAVDFAREHVLLTAVRGGGHSTSGKSTCDGGLVIDLSAMRGVRVDAYTKTARVEGGALLGQLDHETALHGLATTSGTVSHTGAGGLTLGGGYGRLARRFGLACDNVRSFDLVTADGRTLVVDETSHPDLYWGLRGGGGNFGVVTSFDYRLHDVDPIVLGGVIAWPGARSLDVLRFYRDVAATLPDDVNLDAFVAHTPNGPVAGYELCASGDRTRGERVAQTLRAFGKPLVDTIAPMPYVVLQKRNDASNSHGVLHYGKAGFLRELGDRAIDALVESFESAPPGSLILSIQLGGGAIGRTAPDATAFAHRDGSFWLVQVANWTDPSMTEARLAACRASWTRIEPYTSGKYVNSIAEEDYGKLRALYGGNLERMIQLKDRYDPQNLFRLNANVAPSRRA